MVCWVELLLTRQKGQLDFISQPPPLRWSSTTLDIGHLAAINLLFLLYGPYTVAAEDTSNFRPWKYIDCVPPLRLYPELWQAAARKTESHLKSQTRLTSHFHTFTLTSIRNVQGVEFLGHFFFTPQTIDIKILYCHHRMGLWYEL